MPEPTTAEEPRKRPRGRPPGFSPATILRPRTLPRVSEEAYQLFRAYAAAHDCYLTDAIEEAARRLPNPWFDPALGDMILEAETSAATDANGFALRSTN